MRRTSSQNDFVVRRNTSGAQNAMPSTPPAPLPSNESDPFWVSSAAYCPTSHNTHARA